MRYLIIILIIISFSNKTFGQKKYNYKQGYKFIEKAEKKLKNEKLNKAEEFLRKAKLSNYGFCGNAWASAFGEIYLIQTQIHNKRKDYEKALALLDSIDGCRFFEYCEAIDSLKVVTLISKFGKEKVKESFSSVIKIEKIVKDYKTIYSVYLKELNYTFVFGNVEYYFFDTNGKKVEKDKIENELLERIRNHKYFKLLE
ncbi:MAG: hypothetical protein RLZZ175_612 [Bacteroidota bacterium]|jgi:tetratricopeptide (TPR) repeat protein